MFEYNNFDNYMFQNYKINKRKKQNYDVEYKYLN